MSATSKKFKGAEDALKKKLGRPTTAKPNQKSGRSGKTPLGKQKTSNVLQSPSRKKGLTLKERACVAENNYLKN